MPETRVGDLAVVLHSHMPYVEGFGTYPFGEEWLFDAVARSYLPLLEFAHDLTFTVTPVLADQLEAPGVGERLVAFVREHRLGAARAEAENADADLRPAARAEGDVYRRAIETLAALGGDLISAFAGAARERNLVLLPSSATHSVLPLLATDAGRRLQLDSGLRSHHRRFGESTGFWLPECAYVPGLERLLAEQGIGYFCTDQSRHEADGDALAPVATGAGPVAFTLDWPTIERVWSWGGYPSDPAYAEFHRKSMVGIRLWSIAGGAYDPEAAAERAREQAAEFCAAVAERLRAFRAERGREGLVVFAIDTELLGHWWSEGPVWLERMLGLAAEHGIRLVHLDAALGEHDPQPRPLRRSSWGERKDFSTWDSRAVADIAWAARRLELRLLRALEANGISPASAERAARELLAVQSSDWAFLDHRGQAGDYAYTRAVDHSRAMLEAIDSAGSPDPRMRNLAPDMSLAPLREP
ncbi:MAG TPA: 1,4-alpha-glucan branching protein domain-containing protein [Solirubrobacterales bacterium]